MATLLSPKIEPSAEPSVASTPHNQSSSKQMAKCYQADQQVKYLHLQAEIDLLWQQLQTLKQQKQILEKLSVESLESIKLSAE